MVEHGRSSEIRFSSFPMGRWKVVWIGDVDFHSRRRTYSQPTLRVVLDGVDDENRGRRAEATVAIGQIFPLALGRIWQDQVRTSDEDSSQVIRTLEVSTESVFECAAGIPFGGIFGDGYLLPFDSFSHHKNHTKSWCLRCEVEEEQIIIPAAEVIRFYFGSSGSLIKRIFASDFSVESLCSKFEMGPGRNASIDLRSEISSASATDIARIVFDPAALRAAQLVSRSLVSAKASNLDRQIYPRALFPFAGRTSLVVKGLHIEGGDSIGRFLVTEICACGSPFPFKKLHYVSNGKLQAKPIAHDASNSSAATSAKRRAIKQEPGQAIKNDEPKSGTQVRAVVWDRNTRFPDLSGKPVFRVDFEGPKQALLSLMPARPFASTGQGTPSGEGQRIDPIIEIDEKWRVQSLRCPSSSWTSYIAFLQCLAEQPWITRMSFVRLDPRQVQPHYASIPELIDAEGCIIDATLRSTKKKGSQVTHSLRLGSFVNLESIYGEMCLLCLCPNEEEEACLAVVWAEQRLTANNALSALAEASKAKRDTNKTKIFIGVGVKDAHTWAKRAVETVKVWRRRKAP